MKVYSYELQKKVSQSIRLLQSLKDYPVELCYSGGKDSDVMLRLAEMAGISFIPIHKVTTLDPPGTIQHCSKVDNIEIHRPIKTMLQLIQAYGMPTRRARFCCRYLKEYKVMDIALVGIRRSESVRRKIRYKEPIICRHYSNKNKVQQVLPILDWSDSNIEEFIIAENIKLAPAYYDQNGNIVFSRRLGCLGCPMKGDRGLADFIRFPKLGRLWLQSLKIWWDSHPMAHSRNKFNNAEELFVHNLFYSCYEDFKIARDSLIGAIDCVAICQRYGWMD